MRLRRSNSAFTLVELLTVIAVIIILIGITVGTYSYANNRAARSRAESEVRALTAACESYKVDNGEYPRRPGDTAGESDSLDAATGTGLAGPSSSPLANGPYENSSLLLYRLLSGRDANGNAVSGARSYFEFKAAQLGGTKDSTGTVTNVRFLKDPWGYSYGYSTARFYDTTVSPTPVSRPRGYNPTVDLWSTGGRKAADYSTAVRANQLWIKNW
ncbi:MAG: hypothetical protein JSR82_10405 [Verrucomicrobia bacterium]|nr:hypothetical protein [Verrucomicrobiota bacterium]